jgi:hypothetical protein
MNPFFITVSATRSLYENAPVPANSALAPSSPVTSSSPKATSPPSSSRRLHKMSKTPFEVYTREKRNGNRVIFLNSHGMFDFEQLRWKREGEDWEERFQTHTEKKHKNK